MHDPVCFAGHATIHSTAPIFSASAFRDMSGIFKLSSIHTGTPATVVFIRHRRYQHSVVFRLRWKQGNPKLYRRNWSYPWSAKKTESLLYSMQELRYLHKNTIFIIFSDSYKDSRNEMKVSIGKINAQINRK